MKVSLSDAEKSLDFIWSWYEKATSGLRDRLLEEQSRDVGLPRAIFLAMSPEEVQEFFLELDYLSMLDLLSATEASIRADFWTRVNDKRKDDLSRKFRDLVKRFRKKISLDEHVLAAWVEHQPKLNSRSADFISALKLRHWLAHGRYWTPKLGKIGYSPADTFDICDRLLRMMLLK